MERNWVVSRSRYTLAFQSVGIDILLFKIDLEGTVSRIAVYDETYRAERYLSASHDVLMIDGVLVAMHDTVTKVHYVGYGTLREIYRQTSKGYYMRSRTYTSQHAIYPLLNRPYLRLSNTLIGHLDFTCASHNLIDFFLVEVMWSHYLSASSPNGNMRKTYTLITNFLQLAYIVAYTP